MDLCNDIFNCNCKDLGLIAITILIAYMQWQTNERERKQNLYNLRIQFYEEIRKLYLSLDNKAHKIGIDYIAEDDIFQYTAKADWLFGEDMVEALNKLVGKELDYDDQTFRCLPYEVEKVFTKYMKIEKNIFCRLLNKAKKYLKLKIEKIKNGEQNEKN